MFNFSNFVKNVKIKKNKKISMIQIAKKDL